MNMNIKKRIVILGITCGVVTACGGSQQADQAQQQSEQEHVDNGIIAAGSDDPNKWAPSPDAVAKAKADAAAPTQTIGSIAELQNDPQFQGSDMPPPQPEPPKLAQGDEADQFGLPEWEQMARGDLHVKRIRY